MKYTLFLILSIIILICIIVNNIYEGFEVSPITKPTPVRQDNTCSDPGQKNLLDRFDYTMPYDSNGNCPAVKGLTNVFYQSCNYYGQSNCIIPCVSADGWTTYSNDNSLCVRNDNLCKATTDLSQNIQESWAKNCGVIYKQYWNLNSTIKSISSVTGTINDQFVYIDSNINYLSNGVYSNYDCTNPANSNKCYIRDLRYPTILSNYHTLQTIHNTVNSSYIDLSNKQRLFSNIYSSFSCDKYSA